MSDTNGEDRDVARRGGAQAALALGALGVVFGDIGTSPPYTIQTVFNPDDPPVDVTTDAIYGIVSLIFWSVMMSSPSPTSCSSCAPTTTARAASLR
jgi:K+ transporter